MTTTETGHATTPVPTLDYLAWVARQIRIDGALRAGRNEPAPTWRRAIEERERLMALGAPVEWGNPAVTAEDCNQARAVLAYVRAQDVAEIFTDYLRDLCALLAADTIPRDRLALAASAFAVHRAAGERRAREAAEAERRRTSRHVGARGQEIAIPGGHVTSHRQRPSESTGIVHIYDIESAEGNAFTWFAPRADLKLGWTYDLAAVVRKHDDYRGIKKTIVGGVRVVRVVEEGSA